MRHRIPSFRFAVVITAALSLRLASGAATGSVRFVDDDAADGGDGRSWASAYNDLQLALEEAADDATVTEIWIAAGTYRPTARTDSEDPRSATFQLVDGVGLYGGFAGDESSRGARKRSSWQTVLCGDVGDPDVTFDNCYHVVTALRDIDNRTIVDGVTVANGNAQFARRPDSDLSGAGLFVQGGSPTVEECLFRDNVAVFGGAVYCEMSRASFVRCHFENNAARTRGADGFDGLGGAIMTAFSDASLTDCLFIRNRAVVGGAVFNQSGYPTLTRCTFQGNQAGLGGGLYTTLGDPTLNQCLFTGNLAEGPALFRVAAAHGGGIYNDAGSPILIHCTIAGNVATGPESDSFEVSGAGLFSTAQTPAPTTGPRIVNCIFWGNAARDVVEESAQIHVAAGEAQVDFSCVQGRWRGPGANNIAADPLFVRSPDAGPDGRAATDDDDFGDLRLQASSPCIDAGNNDAVPPDTIVDLASRPRFRDDPCSRDTGTGEASIVDMGAFEFMPLTGDLDCDGDTDLADLLTLQACFTGVGGEVAAECAALDFDSDLDIDLSDLIVFQTGFSGAAQRSVRIAALLPNPGGTDRDHEQVAIANDTDADVDLTGWQIIDLAGRAFALTGIAPAGDVLVITIVGSSLLLNNTGDEVWLIDPAGRTRQRVRYERRDVHEDEFVTFP